MMLTKSPKKSTVFLTLFLAAVFLSVENVFRTQYGLCELTAEKT